MKFSVHSTEEEAIAENKRLMSLLGIPKGNTTSYAEPVQKEAGWCLELKESGQWKADHLAKNVQEI